MVWPSIVKVLVGAWALPSAVLGMASQRPFALAPTEELDNSTAPFVFNSLSSLLLQWPNSYHPNGHSIIPATIAPFSPLYHARKSAVVPPPSPEWFAFDPEMSNAIMAPRSGPTYLSTYRTTKSVKVLYFDGMSAALGGSGWLDTQEVLVKGKGSSDEDDWRLWFDDYGRLQRLCKWGVQRGIEGFVRMNTGL